MSAPLDIWAAVKRILRYLKGTLLHGLLLQPATTPSISVRGLCDSDWATDPDDRRSAGGACVYFGPNIITWWSKK